AECGDYLLKTSHGATSKAESLGGMPAHADRHDPLAPDKPCSGPSCSGKSFPPAPPSMPAPVRTENWGHVTTVMNQATPACIYHLIHNSSLHPRHFAIIIYHPPR